MFKAYLDRGQKASPTDEVMCVACTVFKPAKYKQFVRPWERMLDRWNAEAFHATDFYPGGGEFQRDTPEKQKWFAEDCKAIPSLVGENVTRVMAVAFRPREFARKAPLEWKERFGVDTHAMGAQLCLVMNGWWLRDKHPTEYFTYTREAGDEGEAAVDVSVNRLWHDPEYGPLVRIKSYSKVDKGMARGTEAADFVAWHWNKHAVERLDKGIEPRKDFAAFARLTESQGKVQTAFVTGPKLDIFLETMQRAVRDKFKTNDDANPRNEAAK
jgi:hypothetical protein